MIPDVTVSDAPVTTIETTATPIEPATHSTPVIETPTASDEKRGRGRPKMSEEEKARAALKRAESKAAALGLKRDIEAAHPPQAITPSQPTQTVVVVPVAKPTAADIEKTSRAVARTWEMLEALFYGAMVDVDPDSKRKPPEPDEKRARDVGDAWGEILAEKLGSNAGPILLYSVAGLSTAACGFGAIRAATQYNNAVAQEKKERAK